MPNRSREIPVGTQRISHDDGQPTLYEWDGTAWVVVRMAWTIDPVSLTLNGPKGRFNGQEFAAIERPPCPVCGEPIAVDQINVQDARDRFPVFMAGSWRCLNDCDPRPSQRRS